MKRHLFKKTNMIVEKATSNVSNQDSGNVI